MEISLSDQKTLDSLVLIVDTNKEKMKVIEEEMWQEKNSSKNRNNSDKNIENESFTLFAFNPNELGRDDWKKLGIPIFIAERIENYLKKGRRFRIKSDLSKIYGFPKDKYELLQPYIELPDTLLNDSKTTYQKTDVQDKKPEKNLAKILVFDLNSADTLQLQQIKGIGSVLANRIVVYREKLGGFYDFSQLSEVYGLKPEVIEELKKYAKLENVVLRKININTADIETLGKHPYLGFNTAKIIVNYRKQYGKYVQADDLLKVKVLTKEQIQKLQAYLEF
ncbi:MAG: hypothetical protein OHK0038_10010 [Flammeovirgaceae bacterium]